MNLSFLTNLFKKEEKTLSLLDSILVKKLKTVAIINDLDLYANVPIYHHAQVYYIPLILLDPSRGLYIFEKKEWSYDELRNATVEKTQNQEASKDSLAYQNTQEIIHTKFNELIHNDGVPIHNFLLMENLNADEYEHLDDSFKELLPKDRIIFNDAKAQDIVKKLEQVPKQELASRDNILGNLFIQYTTLDTDLQLHFCTQEQIDFIDADILNTITLNGEGATGKSSALLLKALLYKLENPSKTLIIIKPTKLAADIFKKQLLETIEHAIVEVDLATILVLTPIELLNLHLSKLKKELLHKTLFIDESLMRKKFNAADFILCDDVHLLESDFINYLRHIQKNKPLLLVDANLQDSDFTFTKLFAKDEREVEFLKTHPHAKALQLISKLLQDNDAKDILVIANNLSKEKLNDDLEFFIKDKALLLDSSKNLIDQDFNSLCLTTYSDLVGLQAKHVIMFDLCFTKLSELEFAFRLAQESVYILYDEECDEINTLKDKYESRKN
jgi:hypothetical protein